MKRTLLLICICTCTFCAQAQIGGILRQAANKAVQKTAEKAVDKATDKAVEKVDQAIEDEFNKDKTGNNRDSESPSDENATLADILHRLPDLPTAQQLVDYKSAELNGQALKMMASPVARFNAAALKLSIEAISFGTSHADSTQVVETAYKQAEAATGLSREEIDKLSEMSDEEQEAYLKAHYQEGTAEAALLKQAEEAGKYLEPLQPLLDEWESFDNTIRQLYETADNRCREIYGKYADKLENADEKTRNGLLLKYYSEIAPVRREAVAKALRIRLDQQLPEAETIEEAMVKIRAEHQDLFSVLLNYPQLTATQYFTDVTRLIDIPEYK